ncbi:MAG: hypothetical protein V4547_18915 [Bacteroidota bacterium]
MMAHAIIYGIAWAGIMLLINYTMWEGNILAPYYDWLEAKKSKFTKPFGTCVVCMTFWFGLWFLKFGIAEYFIFLGISQVIIVFYSILLALITKQ